MQPMEWGHRTDANNVSVSYTYNGVKEVLTAVMMSAILGRAKG